MEDEIRIQSLNKVIFACDCFTQVLLAIPAAGVQE